MQKKEKSANGKSACRLKFLSKDYKKDVSAFGRWELNPHDSQKVGSDSESVVRALTAEQAC